MHLFPLLFLSQFIIVIDGVNVLVFLPGTNQWERRMLNKVAQELAFRNHGVATFKGIIIPETKYLVMHKLHNVREIALKQLVGSQFYEPIKEIGNEIPWRQSYDILQHRIPTWRAYANACEPILNSDLMNKLKKDKFDISIVYSGQPCHMAIAHAVGLPFIYLDMEGFTDETVFASGSASLPHLIPSSDSQFSTPISYLQQIENAWMMKGEAAAFANMSHLPWLFSPRWHYLDGPITKLFQNDLDVKKRYKKGTFPSISELKKKAVAYFVNSDPLLEYGRPVPPNVVYVGGMHVEFPRPLFEPYNTTNLLAKDGVIIGSMGTVANSSAMPQHMHDAFMGAFKRLKDNRIYWRIGHTTLVEEPFQNIPENVNVTVHVAQNDLLAAKETKLLITNGGMKSIMEAIYHGVPVLGIPLYGSNYNNLRKVEANNFGIILDKIELTEEKLFKTIRKLLDEPKYRLAAKKMSRLFKDRPMTAFETAIYHIEHLARHKDSHKIISPNEGSSWIQLLGLDVQLLCLIVLYIIIQLIYSLIACLLRFLMRQEQQKQNQAAKYKINKKQQ